MKVYSSPLPAPAFNFDTWRKDEDDYIEILRGWLRDHGYKHRLTGKVVRFPVADGYAQYMVMDGRSMVHLPLLDAYQIPDAHARGLRVRDIDALLAADRRMAELFGKSKHAKSGDGRRA